MSGTPTIGNDDAAALTQMQRLLSFLRHPEYGLEDGKRRWDKVSRHDIAGIRAAFFSRCQIYRC